MRAATLMALAAQAGVAVTAVPRFWPGMGLDAALGCFATTLRALQRPEAVARVASEIAEDAVFEGVSTLELRFAPQLHLAGIAVDDRAAAGAVAAVVDAALEGLDGRAGLLLCVLYGDAPALAEVLVDVAIARPGVVGVDLAGGPSPQQRWRMTDYAAAFQRARAAGVGVTVHAGEGRPPAEIAVAIETLGAQRIGHGTTLLRGTGPQDARILDLVRDAGVTIEACVTSNVHVGAIAAASDHDLPRWLDLGVRVAICTDNTLLSDVDAPTEHARVAAIPGMTAAHLAAAVAFGHAARFQR